VNNYLRRLEKFAVQHQLLERIKELDDKATSPLSKDMILEYETLEQLRCKGVHLAERKCRKLRMGNISFSPEVQQARRVITAWSLIKKRARGLRTSSRLLSSEGNLRKQFAPPYSFGKSRRCKLTNVRFYNLTYILVFTCWLSKFIVK
jgi:hypothetical protein